MAKVVPQRRGMWHSIRRKWATERKGYPVKDVAAGRRLEDRGGADDVIPTGRRRDDQERRVAPDQPDCEPVGREKLTALLTAWGRTKKKPHSGSRCRA